MDNIQFDTDTYSNKPPRFQNEPDSFLTKMAMKLGAKDQKQAQMVLLGIAVTAIILTIIVIITQFTYVGNRTVIVPPVMPRSSYP